MQPLLQLTGIGLRAQHYAEVIDKLPGVAWLEVHSENYFGDGGKALQALEDIREHYPVSLHGIGLSLGSSDELNWQHLRKLSDLINRIDPCLISDHLSWSSLQGQYFHDLLPLPYTQESLSHLSTRIQQVQDFLKRPILIENISSYVQFEHSTMTESVFLAELAKQSGCGILLDVNNIYVNAINHQWDVDQYLADIPKQLVHEIHLAGFSKTDIDGKEILIDTHDHPVTEEVWALYQKTIRQIGRKPTIIEWDDQIPHLETLCQEAYRAEQIMREIYVAPAKCAV